MVDFIAQKVGMCCALLSIRLSVCHTYRQLWRYVDFSRWQPYRRKYSFAFWFYDISLSGRQRTICVSNLDHNYISIHGQVITISGCWKQTSAIFKFYSRFRRTLHRHRHVILHWLTKFYANRMIADGVMTSYWFYKMAAIASQIYFRFLIWPRLILRKAHSNRPIGVPDFDQISQSTVEILLLPVSENKRPPSWNSTSVSVLTLLLPSACGFPSACQISSKSDYPRQSYDVIAIFKMAAVSHVGFGLGQW